MTPRDLVKAALYGEPSYIWRDGQERRLGMIRSTAGDLLRGCVLENGCGVGMYLQHLAPYTGSLIGLEYDLQRAREAHNHSPDITNAACERLPFASESFDVILSHEVLEHVRDDRQSAKEMLRVLKPHGLIALFVPNLGYPYETHGIYWKGQYHFGNIPFVHYLPARWRRKLTPHVRAYSASDLNQLFVGLQVKIIQQDIIFGAYDNIISRSPTLGKLLRKALQWLERTPLRIFGLSHFWVIEKN